MCMCWRGGEGGICVGRGGEGGGGGSWKPTGRLLLSSRESGEGLMRWLETEESSVLRLVTGVVRLGGIGGDGLAGARLAPPVAWVKSPANRQIKETVTTSNHKAKRFMKPVSELLARARHILFYMSI